MTGQAFCFACPLGKYYNETGANSSALCQNCPKGEYGNKDGLAVCTKCPRGQIQPTVGMSNCHECKIDDLETSNDQHTECIDSGLLDKRTLAETLLDEGLALGGTFAVALTFMALAAMMTYMREKEPDKLANYSRLEALWNSGMAGLSFGVGEDRLFCGGDAEDFAGRG